MIKISISLIRPPSIFKLDFTASILFTNLLSLLILSITSITLAGKKLIKLGHKKFQIRVALFQRMIFINFGSKIKSRLKKKNR